MRGWRVPSPAEPRKPPEQLLRERRRKVEELEERGLLESERIRDALLAVPRESFIPREYRDHAYEELPLPLPGTRASISCPHSYPLFYEPLGLDRGHHFLEVGLGSGYGAAVAREVVGREGLVVSVEIDPVTRDFGLENLRAAGYDDVLVVRDDGSRGYAPEAPYDRIAVTAAVPEIPRALTDQLSEGGRLVGPVSGRDGQELTLVKRAASGFREEVLCRVLYVPLRREG